MPAGGTGADRAAGRGGVLLRGFLPGALAGAQIAELLFFLNPALPWRVTPVLRAIVWYAGELGLASLVLHLPLLANGWRHRARRLLPWTLTAVLTGSAILDGTQASYYAYYLPTGINDRLIKTAIWLALGALIAFYTALLHTVDRRRYGWRSRLGLGLVCLLALLVPLERRAAFHPRPPLAAHPAVVERAPRPHLRVIGLDTATLDAILPLAGQGQLPFLAQLLRQGAYCRLGSLTPVRPEALWTTLATGKFPWQHGVTGGPQYAAPRIGPEAELRLLPAGIGFGRWGLPPARGRLLHGSARQTLTLWEILPRLGISAGVVSWPASAPVSRETDFAFSDRYFGDGLAAEQAWPPDLGDWGRRFRVEPRTALQLLGGRLGPGTPPPMLRAFAADLWREALAGALLDRDTGLGGLFVVLPGLRQVSAHTFGGFSAAQFHGIQTADDQEAAERLTDYYSRLDSFLAEIWRHHGADDILAVVSASGMEGAFGWRRVLGELSREVSLGGSDTGAPDGVLMLYGAGVQPGALLTGAQLVDVVPTLMYALNLPVARDLDGVVLTPAFDKSFLSRHPLTFLPTYETLPARPAPAGGTAGSSAGASSAARSSRR
jgi:hypothetical protein